MRSGSNWCFLKGKLDRVTTRTLANGQQVSEVHLQLPLGRAPHETGVMDVVAVTWNAEYAALLASLPHGTSVSITGHIAARHWTMAGGIERRGTEVRLDSVAIDVVDVFRHTDGAAHATP
jgi:single-stranded DNA-binding protein